MKAKDYQNPFTQRQGRYFQDIEYKLYNCRISMLDDKCASYLSTI